MIEFSLALVVVVPLIIMVFDLALNLYQFSLLTYVTNNAARELAVDRDIVGNFCLSGHDILTPRDPIETRADEFAEGFGISKGLYRFHRQPTIFDADDNADQFVLDGFYRPRCLFLCSLLPHDFELKSSAKVKIEGSCSKHQGGHGAFIS